VDACVTDPPAGISFMNKKWDSDKGGRDAWIAWLSSVLAECYRVAKPGTTLLCWAIPRTSHWTGMAIEQAGWQPVDVISHLFGCLSEDTEILTDKGWQRYSTQLANYSAMCYNVTDSTFYLAPIEETFAYDYDDTAFRIQSDTTDQLVSRNHRCLVERGGRTTFEYAERLSPEEGVPILESLFPLSPTFYNERQASGTTEPLLLKGVPSGTVVTRQARQDNEASTCLQAMRKGISSLWHWRQTRQSNCEGDVLQLCVLRPLAQPVTRNQRAHEKDRGTGTVWMDRGKLSQLCRQDVWAEQPRLERWRNLLSQAWQLCTNQVCTMSRTVLGYGSQRWLCYGTQNIGSSTNWKTIIENRSNTSFGSQSRKQQNRKFDVIQNKQGTQTTRASVRKEFYDGIIYCPTVSTGCFIARRNGKIFLTGNSGFPKAGNIGKMIDKRGTENYRFSELNKELCDYLKMAREGLGLSQKDIAKHFLSKTGGLTGCVWNWENGANIPTMGQWEKLKGILKLADEKFITLIERTILKREEAEREIAKERKQMVGGNFTYVKYSGNADITLPATPQAKALDGSYAGYQPKPAVEIIIVCMKPLQKTDNEKVKLDFEQLRNLKRLLNEEQLQV